MCFTDEIILGWITVYCARDVLNGTVAGNDGPSMCTCPGCQTALKITQSLSTTVNVCESLREARDLNIYSLKKKGQATKPNERQPRELSGHGIAETLHHAQT